MNLQEQLAISYYKTIAVIDDAHRVFLVQHQETGKIYIKKILDVYNIAVYMALKKHPIAGTPKIQEVIEDDNNLIIIEEYISGISLEEKIQNALLSKEDCISYMKDLCEILDSLHKLDPPIIHRDIKPSNIMITEYNRAVLLDFNAAKHFTEIKNQDTVLLGTTGYAAPEQYGFGSSSPQTDIYALGVVLKEMLQTTQVKDFKLQQIADTCVKIDPAGRYASAEELKRALPGRQYPDEEHHEAGSESFLPPGFRTKTPWKMAAASLGYFMILWLCMTLEIENATRLKEWIERIACLIMLLGITAGSCNYRNIQRMMPLCHNDRRMIRYAGVVLLDVLLSLVVLLVLGFIEAAFSIS